ncbi:MAG TPA: dTDP-4-dehydrorhamnose reductase [Methylophilaceae bacterium]|nr:dTDP-4-dehydrorhamnose reductase [Methylophilaceae bacterium]
MNILLLGKNGQVGWELQRSLSPLGQLLAVGRHEVDFYNIDDLRRCVQHYQPKIIVNAAAYTAVDKAESEPEKAYRINAEAVSALAEESDRLGAWLVHYSTDYVFDGNKAGAYLESDAAHPLSIYGQSKLAGENAIRNVGCKHLVFRSSWVYSVYGANFPLAILRRALEMERIDVVADSIGAPTSAHLIADVTALVLHQLVQEKFPDEISGTYHLTATGETSWYEYAQFIVRLARKRGLPVKVAANRVFPMSIDSYQAAARRPKNSRLDVDKIREQFYISFPDLKIHFSRFIEEISKARPL